MACSIRFIQAVTISMYIVQLKRKMWWKRLVQKVYRFTCTIEVSQIAPPPPDKFLGMFPLSIFSHRQTSPGAEWAVSVEPSQIIWGLHFSSSEERWSRLIKLLIASISLVFILAVVTRERHIKTNFKFVV